MALIAEIYKDENSYNNNYICNVYDASYIMVNEGSIGSILTRRKTKGKNKHPVLEGIKYRPTGIKRIIDPSSKKLLLEMILSATQASKSKAKIKINQTLASSGLKDRIESADIYTLKN